jgi:hypothetical protein
VTAKLKRAMVALKRLSTTAETERSELEQLVKEQRLVIARLRKDLAVAKTAPDRGEGGSTGSGLLVPWGGAATGMLL